MNETTLPTTEKKTPGTYRPRLSFYHPNARCTGCAMQMELHPAHDRTDGSIMMSVANQVSVGDRSGASPVFPRFDWEKRLTVKLDFADLSKILQVLRGECESLEDGKGLFHRAPRFTTRIVFRHLIEPVQGYSLEVYRSGGTSGADVSAHIFLSPWEALGLCEAISGAMAIVSFGIPMLVDHDTSAYEAEVKGMKNGRAA